MNGTKIILSEFFESIEVYIRMQRTDEEAKTSIKKIIHILKVIDNYSLDELQDLL